LTPQALISFSSCLIKTADALSHQEKWASRWKTTSQLVERFVPVTERIAAGIEASGMRSVRRLNEDVLSQSLPDTLLYRMPAIQKGEEPLGHILLNRRGATRPGKKPDFVVSSFWPHLTSDGQNWLASRPRGNIQVFSPQNKRLQAFTQSFFRRFDDLAGEKLNLIDRGGSWKKILRDFVSGG
jgi:hypothetical protein